MNNMVNKCVFNDTTVTCKTIADNGTSWKITQNESINNIKDMNKQI